jgi:hypothetical protein
MSGDPTAFVMGGTGGLRRRADGAPGDWIGLAIVAALVILPLKGLYRFTGGTMEEGFMLYFPERMWEGDVPNVDFLHLYGPGALHVLMGWYKVFGETLFAERTFGLLQHVGIIFGLFALARPWGRTAAAAVASLSVFYILTPIGLTAMAWNGGLALTLWSAVFVLRGLHVAEGRHRHVCWLVAGILAGLALTYRPDLAIALGLVVGWLAITRPDSRADIAVGAVTGLLPMWIHLAIAGPAASFRGMFLDPVFELRAGRELPRPPSWDRLDGALQKIAEFVPPWWELPHLSVPNGIFLWFFAMLILTALLLAFALWQRRTFVDGRSTALLLVAFVSLGILPQALQRPDSTHLTWVTCISWPFLIVGGAEVVRRLWSRTALRAGLLVGGAFALALTFVLTSLFTFRYYIWHTRVGMGYVEGAYEVRRDDRVFFFGHNRAALASQLVIDDLAKLSEPGERLFVGPHILSRTFYSDAVFYWMFPELEPATYFIEMDPGLANEPGSRLADDLRTADWVILTSFWAGWDEPNASVEYGSSEPDQVIDSDFRLYREYVDGLIRLYYRRD